MNIIRKQGSIPQKITKPEPAVTFNVTHNNTREPKARARTVSPPWRVRQEQERAEARRALRSGKPFVAWDGEGVHADDGTMHYVLLGHSENDGTYISSHRLTTDECLSFIYEETREHADKIHVSFGFNFDVDQILRDVPTEKLEQLKKHGDLVYHGYKIRYIKWKMFSVSKGRSRGVTIYDTITFFQTNLIGAAHQYIPDDDRIGIVEQGKQGRKEFVYSELDSITRYWKIEGELFCSIMYALRSSMLGAGINLDKWHGPGAVAESLIKKHHLATHIQESRTDMPLEVEEATAYAFFGGRFECRRIGHIDAPTYTYDINSAYPAALSKVPMLINGRWEHNGYAMTSINEWGIYRVTNHGHKERNVSDLAPLPCRTSDGNVYFPLTCTGWYYGHEVKAAIMTGWDIEIHESWEYVTDEPSAFMFLEDMFNLRKEAKANGNPAQLAYKLGMNSIYGKLAQLIGWDEKNNLPPKFHQQWYAGQTTSWTRARIYLAYSQQPFDFISCETDSITTTAPLSLKIGSYLGQWEANKYEDYLYIQSGIYFGKKDGKWLVSKTRGIGKNIINVEDAFKALPTLSRLSASNHRYGGMSGYLGKDKHWTWFDQTVEVKWGGEGKRHHVSSQCDYCQRMEHPVQHITVITAPSLGMSVPRAIPWIDGKIHDEPDMDDDIEDWTE